MILWHPDSPGSKVDVKPGFWRRVGVVRSPFATLSEVCKIYKDRERSWKMCRKGHIVPGGYVCYQCR